MQNGGLKTPRNAVGVLDLAYIWEGKSFKLIRVDSSWSDPDWRSAMIRFCTVLALTNYVNETGPHHIMIYHDHILRNILRNATARTFGWKDMAKEWCNFTNFLRIIYWLSTDETKQSAIIIHRQSERKQTEYFIITTLSSLQRIWRRYLMTTLPPDISLASLNTLATRKTIRERCIQ